MKLHTGNIYLVLPRQVVKARPKITALIDSPQASSWAVVLPALAVLLLLLLCSATDNVDELAQKDVMHPDSLPSTAARTPA